MKKIKLLNKVKEIYAQGGNMMEYLRKYSEGKNDIESIMISYDFQSGAYIKETENNHQESEKSTSIIAKIINDLIDNPVILEVGIGEATTMVGVLKKLNSYKSAFGFDISWSRINQANFYQNKKQLDNKINLFTGNLFNIPLPDNSIEIVYTSHSIEPNGGKEKEALIELHRIATKYIILIEPGYEFANEEGKKRMEKHGYVKNIKSAALDLKMNVIRHELHEFLSDPLNPSALTIIKVDKDLDSIINEPYLCCPNSMGKLTFVEGGWFSRSSYLYYPQIKGVPCLLSENAVLCSQLELDL